MQHHMQYLLQTTIDSIAACRSIIIPAVIGKQAAIDYKNRFINNIFIDFSRYSFIRLFNRFLYTYFILDIKVPCGKLIDQNKIYKEYGNKEKINQITLEN